MKRLLVLDDDHITCSVTTLTYSWHEESHRFLMVETVGNHQFCCTTKHAILDVRRSTTHHKPFKYRYVLRPFLRNCHLAQEEDPPQGTKVWGETRRV